MVCSICLNEIENNDEYKTNCNHTFHKKCIDKWLISNEKMSCALCRESFVNKNQGQNVIINEETQSRIFRNEIQSI